MRIATPTDNRPEPSPGERFHRALAERDPSFDGIFLAGVRTTGVFCRPSCPARTPDPCHVTYFDEARDAVLAGFRPCKRCRPLAPEPPEWLPGLLDRVEARGSARWRDQDLRDLGPGPEGIRAWFSSHLGLTFHAYARVRAVRFALQSGAEDFFGPADRESRVVASWLDTPLGGVVVAASPDGVCLLEFADRPMLRTQLRRLVQRVGAAPRPGHNAWLERLESELAEYFTGSRRAFSVPVVSPGSRFQEAVWAEIRRIPFGETRSYAQMAGAVGRPSAVRAVGRANGDNRIAILVPCHRVVGSDGALRGYGGGLWRKARLLSLEGARTA